MKITHIEVFNIGLKLKKPFKNAKMIREKSSNTIIKVRTDEGIDGYGEATFTHFFAGETQESVSSVVNNFLSPAIWGEDPRNIFDCIDKMNGAIVGNVFAKAAVETALWDIKGKELGVPIYQLLGGCRRKSIPVNHSVSYGSVGEMVDQAVEHVESGFTTLKIYCGRENPEADLERVKAIRKAVGQGIDLYVEANQRWSFKNACNLAPALGEMGILFMEQPISRLLRDEMRILRERSSVPIAVDESVFEPEDIFTVKKEGLADIVNVYVLKSGGILPGRRALDVSETLGLDTFIGSLNELSISSMAGGHLAATILNLKYPCYLVGPLHYEEDILEESLEIKDGMLKLSDHAGLGIKVSEKQIKKFMI
jgi:L-alanine-DL-glutamate epimerase-like enolase superfamily enzyme